MEKTESTVVSAPVVPEKKQRTAADRIWDDIKEVEVAMFALPGQVVQDYCKQITIEPTRCYLLPTATSLLPVLEEKLKGKYVVELLNKYIVVYKKVDIFA